MGEKKQLSRKEFLKLAGTATTATLAAGLIDLKNGIAKEEVSSPQEGADLSKLPADIVKKNELLQMQQDLARVLKKPMNERKWSMVLDLRKCIGCSACATVSPETFKMTGDKAHLIGGKLINSIEVLSVKEIANNQEAADVCPVPCIFIKKID